MASRKQFLTDHPISFTLRLTADNSLATGKTPTVELSKDGGSFSAASGSITEVGNGLYSLVISAIDTNTVGELWAHITEADCVEQTVMLCEIVGYDAFGNVPGLVWEELVFDHITETTFGEYFSQQLSQIITDRVSHVWDEIPFDHTDPESFAQILAVTLDSKVSDVPSNVWAYVLEGTKSAAWFMRVFLAALTGKLTGVTTDHPLFKGLDGTTTRIDTTTSADGRDVPTLDGD